MTPKHEAFEELCYHQKYSRLPSDKLEGAGGSLAIICSMASVDRISHRCQALPVACL